MFIYFVDTILFMTSVTLQLHKEVLIIRFLCNSRCVW